VREYTDGDGRLCRVYERLVVIEGAPQTAYATVCREADGRWVLSR
jgi:surface antigen